MAEESLVFYSTIAPSLLRRTLLRGFLLAFLGALALIIAAIFLSPSQLKIWGWLIFLFGMGCIAIGLVPYRKLSRLAAKPNQIRLVFPDYFQFISQGELVLTLPLKEIETFTYIDDGRIYGIGVQLKPSFRQRFKFPPSLKKIPFSHTPIDLFFPYFSKRSFDELIVVDAH